MPNQNSRKFRAVNPSLGTSPKVGPFPADQVIPWTAIFLISYYICKSVFGLSWLWTGIVAVWGMSTWWVLTGSKAWRYMSKFIATPNWTRGYARYERVCNSRFNEAEGQWPSITTPKEQQKERRR